MSSRSRKRSTRGTRKNPVSKKVTVKSSDKNTPDKSSPDKEVSSEEEVEKHIDVVKPQKQNRRSKSSKEKKIKEIKEIKEKKDYKIKVTYLTPDNQVAEKIVTLSEDDIFENASYKENVQIAASFIADEGGLWIDSDNICPYHRILLISCYKDENSKSNIRKTTAKKKATRHRRSSQASEKPEKSEKAEKSEKPEKAEKPENSESYE
jgi:hypothetical protein